MRLLGVVVWVYAEDRVHEFEDILGPEEHAQL